MTNFGFHIVKALRLFNSKFKIQHSKFYASQRGSILIVTLLAIGMLALLTASLTFVSRQHLMLMHREMTDLEIKADRISVLNWAMKEILADPDAYEDSFEDDWYGELDMPEPWKGHMTAHVEDEESKVNLNGASEAFLRAFLDVFEEEVEELKGEKRPFIREILKARQEERLASYEELYLMEDIEREDVEKLRQYLTVYPELPWLNLNTASDLALEALIRSLQGDDLAKDELLQKLTKVRNESPEEDNPYPFTSEDLEPETFIRILRLQPNLQMSQLVNRFLRQVTTDSRTYRVVIENEGGARAQAMMRQIPDGIGMEVMSWYEG